MKLCYIDRVNSGLVNFARTQCVVHRTYFFGVCVFSLQVTKVIVNINIIIKTLTDTNVFYCNVKHICMFKIIAMYEV